jgi:protein arginine kinase activator
MLCEQCKQREAVTHIRRVINGVAEEHHLCAECARENGLQMPGASDFGFHVGDLFGSFLGGGLGAFSSAKMPPGTRRCDFCGSSLAEIAKEGRVGCADCYSTFYEQLRPTLQRIHGGMRHSGKAPALDPEAEAARQKQQTLEELREKIAAAIREERYEDAAKLRDEIQQLEKGGGAQ